MFLRKQLIQENFCPICKIQLLSKKVLDLHAKEKHLATITAFGLIEPLYCECGKRALYRISYKGYCADHRNGASVILKKRAVNYTNKTISDMPKERNSKRKSSGFQLEYRMGRTLGKGI